LGQVGPLAARVIVGVIMVDAGYQKVANIGPATFGETLAKLGVPAPIFMGYVVTFTELFGGALLIVGLLSRLAALVLTIDLIVAIVLVNAQHGLLTPMGAALPVALIAGFLVVLLTGPGALSLDRALGIEPQGPPGPPEPAAPAP
jgi:putative oxidoreductase